jgi:RNA polymerase sigma factor (sigma-70 family)
MSEQNRCRDGDEGDGSRRRAVGGHEQNRRSVWSRGGGGAPASSEVEGAAAGSPALRKCARSTKETGARVALLGVGVGAREIEAVYRARYSRFRNGIAVLTGSAAVAHDAVQEAFAEALSQRAEFRGGSLEAWIWRVAVRVARREAAGGRPPAEGVVDLDAAIALEHRDEALLEALRGLSPRRRLIVFLRYYAELSYSEIAEACGVSEGTVAASLAQAREQLEVALREGATC